MPFIEIKNISKSFDDFVVLDDISLNIQETENMVLFGRSGTGKSVLLKCIVRLLEPDKGEIFIEGKNVLELNLKKLNEVRKQIGFLFQSAALYDSMSVRENLEFPLIRNFNFTPAERERNTSMPNSMGSAPTIAASSSTTSRSTAEVVGDLSSTVSVSTAESRMAAIGLGTATPSIL